MYMICDSDAQRLSQHLVQFSSPDIPPTLVWSASVAGELFAGDEQTLRLPLGPIAVLVPLSPKVVSTSLPHARDAKSFELPFRSSILVLLVGRVAFPRDARESSPLCAHEGVTHARALICCMISTIAPLLRQHSACQPQHEH